jgi:hypothetical protein
MRTKRGKQDLHFLDANGMVACNPRDREAAHRAEVENIATRNGKAVTCRKCRVVMRNALDKRRPGEAAPPTHRTRENARDE